ncbi:MAG TPA: (E)-4-hydroxy-3-methylbut-2-enyl-diphosphate synthase, partial [Leptospiraceae bacterium]|nr:(E)-4-hydroxy-3-methylbut-2-enyl-diphosphate synthase [Leptospiraceae bacterium]
MQNIVQPAEAGLIPETFADSPFAYSRFRTREVKVGNVGVGGTNPIRIQSMTISDTMDTEATVKEAIGLIEAGCEIVRITAPRVKEAENLKNIKNRLVDLGYNQPLVADIHFLPQAAMTAVEYVEKVRINPGNFADRKFFELREYTDSQYEEELERIHDAFRPLVLRARELGRALRIGTNHGSLSDRIMNRYGDTALGMVESALEFIRIAEHYDFRDIIISMKASNPGVMIQAYRLLVARFRRENMDYPLHLGVTEAGGGKDGRIKSSIGIGSLLDDGIGDTIRVSLTEDSIHEIPVARKIASYYDARRALAGTSENGKKELEKIYIQSFPYHRYDRRGSDACTVIGGKNPIKIGMREELVRPEDAAS